MKKFIFFVAFIFVASLYSSVSESIDRLDPKHKKLWEEKAEYFEQVTDGLGKHLDAKIKNLVVVLNLLGIKTRQSCEGHLDWGNAYPWIDLDFSSAYLIEEKRRLVLQKLDEVESKLKDKECIKVIELISERDKLESENSDLFHKFLKERAKCGEKAYQLLQEFNGDRLIYSSIIINGSGIMPIGGIWEDYRSIEQKKECLDSYRKEMDRFTEFLIEKFKLLEIIN